MFYGIEVDPNSTTPNPGRGTGDLTALELGSVANAVAAAVALNATATSENSRKGVIKAGINNKYDLSATNPLSDQIKLEACLH